MILGSIKFDSGTPVADDFLKVGDCQSHQNECRHRKQVATFVKEGACQYTPIGL